jgi:hypothetical protein
VPKVWKIYTNLLILENMEEIRLCSKHSLTSNTLNTECDKRKAIRMLSKI